MKSLSCGRLLATPRTAAYQAPPPRGFSRQEYWSGVPICEIHFWAYIWRKSEFKMVCAPLFPGQHFFFFYSSWGMQSTKMSRKWWLNGPSIHSAITQNEAMPLPAACMDREIIVRCEVRKRKTNILRYHLQVECKNSYKWTNLQSRNRLTKLEKQLMLIQRNVRG